MDNLSMAWIRLRVETQATLETAMGAPGVPGPAMQHEIWADRGRLVSWAHASIHAITQAFLACTCHVHARPINDGNMGCLLADHYIALHRAWQCGACRQASC
jgi:hypothetical protein